MGLTIIEKIVRNNVGRAVHPGEIVTVNVDRVMIHDIFIPFVASKFEEMGFTKIWDADKAVLIYDHLVPASQVDDTRHFRVGNEFAEKYGMKNIHRSDGICHQLMTEAGYVKPGDIVFGTDSHTTTYGCVGAFSSGIGYTEMASILGTGTLWIRVPETIKVNITGKLPENVMAKDIILKLIGDLGADGATYKALEFTGDTVENMTVASRMSMSNMAIEAGAKCALFTPDEKTAAYCGIELTDKERDLIGDADAQYCRVIEYRAEDFVPVMACPSNVDNVRPVSEIAGKEIDQVFIGSCTNGRLEDLMAAIKEGLAAGYRRFELYGTLGGRLDHTLANIQCLLYLRNRGGKGVIVGDEAVLMLIRNESITLTAERVGNGKRISVFAFGGDAHGVSEKGLKYLLDNVTVKLEYPIGVSNEFIGEDAEIEVKDGMLLIYVEGFQ